MKNVEEKVVVITGASSGIGEVTARLLVENGAKVVLGARREEKLKELTKQFGEDNSVYHVTDVCKREDVNALVAKGKEKFGKVDVLFANAGIMPVSSMSEMKTDEWDDMVDINIKGVLNSFAAVIPEFTKQKPGHVIATSSVAGLKVYPGNTIYTATKHAVRAIMEGFRMESATEKTNIRTTTLYPGSINTELLETISTPEVKEGIQENYDKVGITPDAVARTVLFAISEPENVGISEVAIIPTAQVE